MPTPNQDDDNRTTNTNAMTKTLDFDIPTANLPTSIPIVFGFPTEVDKIGRSVAYTLLKVLFLMLGNMCGQIHEVIAMRPNS